MSLPHIQHCVVDGIVILDRSGVAYGGFYLALYDLRWHGENKPNLFFFFFLMDMLNLCLSFQLHAGPSLPSRQVFVRANALPLFWITQANSKAEFYPALVAVPCLPIHSLPGDTFVVNNKGGCQLQAAITVYDAAAMQSRYWSSVDDTIS